MSEESKTKRIEKTIGPETFVPPQEVRRYSVTQDQLRKLDDIRFEIKQLEIAAKAAQDDILASIEGMSSPSLEPGEYAYISVPNFKRSGVDWKREIIDNLGLAYADELEAKAKSERKEVSSYSVKVSKIGD